MILPKRHYHQKGLMLLLVEGAVRCWRIIDNKKNEKKSKFRLKFLKRKIVFFYFISILYSSFLKKNETIVTFKEGGNHERQRENLLSISDSYINT